MFLPRVGISFLDHLTPTTLAAISVDMTKAVDDVDNPAHREFSDARVFLSHVNTSLSNLVGDDEAAELKAAIAANQ